MPAFRTSFGLSDTLLGAVGGGSYLGYCLTIVAASWGVARFGARPVAVAAGLAATTGMAIVAVAPSPPLLAAGALIAGSSTGLASPPMAEGVARWLPTGRQVHAQSLVNAGPGFGIALSGPVALFTLTDWRQAWAAFAAIAVAVTIWVWSVLPTPPRLDQPHRPAIALRALRAESAPRLSIVAAAFGAASSWVWTFGRDHLTTAGTHDQHSAIALWIVLGVAGTAGVHGGRLIERHGLRRIWRTSLVAMAAATTILGAVPGAVLPAGLAMATFGAAYMILTIVVFFAAIELDPRHPATTTGLGFFMITLGQALAAPLAGALTGHLGPTPAYLAFTAAALATSTTAPPTRATRPRPADGRRPRQEGATRPDS